MHYLADPRHSFCASVRDSDLLGIDKGCTNFTDCPRGSRNIARTTLRDSAENGSYTRVGLRVIKLHIKYKIVFLNRDIVKYH